MESNSKRNRVYSNVEDILYDKLYDLATEANTSISALIRGLVISELLSKQKLNAHDVRRLLGVDLANNTNANL